MKKVDHFGVRTWIEVDRSALKHNYRVFRNLISTNCKLMAVAKSNAYGHGIVDYARVMEKLGADWFGVDSITEALTLRKKDIKKPILILGYTLPERLEEALSKDISLTISNFESLENIRRLKFKKKFKIHLKIDSGMHRQGFLPEQIDELINKLSAMDNVLIEGIYTHFAAAYYPDNRKYTHNQIKIFNKIFAKLQSNYPDLIKHASATAGTLNYPEAHFDMVRVGIGLMGLMPTPNQHGGLSRYNIGTVPALSWRTIATEIKNLPNGSLIGYDLSEKLKRRSKIAICPVGYWHGLPRTLSGKGEVLIGGKRSKILGRVCMDMIVIDATDLPDLKVGDVATIIGRDGTEEISAYEVAKTADYSHYEIMTRLNPLIKRIYI